MRAKEDLFHLIKAMSKSEKRYFTLDAKKSGKEGAKYIELFQLINAMEEYNEVKLKKRFPRNLSSDKGYLYEAILRSMRDYRSAKSKTAQIKERLMDSRYLYERGLYGQFEDRMKEAKNMVQELEDKFTLLEINKEEQVANHERKGHSKEYLAYLESLNLEREDTLNAVLEELKYLDLYFQLSVEVLREFVLKDPIKINSLKNKVPPELLDDQYLPNSAHAQKRFLQCKALFHQLLGENDKAHQNFSAVVQWWDEHKVYKEEEFFRYIIDISNLLNNCFTHEEYQNQIPELLNKLDKENPSTIHEQGILFQKVSISKLLFHFHKNDFEGAKKLVPEIEQGLKKFNSKKEIVLIANIVILFFVLYDYPNCLKWAQKIIQLKSGKRQDIQRLMRLIQLICMFEMQEIDKLEGALRSTTRYFKKLELSKSSFEISVLALLKKVFHAPIGEQKSIFQELRLYLDEKNHKPKGKKPLGVEELLLWVNQKK